MVLLKKTMKFGIQSHYQYTKIDSNGLHIHMWSLVWLVFFFSTKNSSTITMKIEGTAQLRFYICLNEKIVWKIECLVLAYRHIYILKYLQHLNL